MSSDDLLFLAKNVSKRFGGLIALNDVTVSIPEDSLTLLIGPNGSGKTTFLQVASGVLKPDSGLILFKKLNVTGLPPHVRFKLGVATTFQIPKLFPSLSVLENVLVAARNVDETPFSCFRDSRVRERELIEKAFDVLKLLSLDRVWDKPAYTLSGGQMKLLELARALMSDPKLLLLDEPLAGVNPALAGSIMQFLTKIRKEHEVGMLLVEHRLDLALRYADYVYVLHNGRVISEGSPEAVVEDPAVAKAYLGE
jgi:branched-chain amino acid transport system ATP-binding protein